MANAKVILPAVIEAVLDSQAKHWNSEVRELAKKALNRLTVLDPRLSHELLHPLDPKVDSQVMQSWVLITDAASRNGHRVGGKVVEISRVFGAARPRPPMLTDTKGMRRQSAMSQVQLPLLVPIKDVTPSTRFPLGLRK